MLARWGLFIWKIFLREVFAGCNGTNDNVRLTRLMSHIEDSWEEVDTMLVVVRLSNWRGETLPVITIMAGRTARHDGVCSLSSLPLSPPVSTYHLTKPVWWSQPVTPPPDILHSPHGSHSEYSGLDGGSDSSPVASSAWRRQTMQWMFQLEKSSIIVMFLWCSSFLLSQLFKLSWIFDFTLQLFKDKIRFSRINKNNSSKDFKLPSSHLTLILVSECFPNVLQRKWKSLHKCQLTAYRISLFVMSNVSLDKNNILNIYLLIDFSEKIWNFRLLKFIKNLSLGTIIWKI